jgi:hypothetical protein
MDDMAQSKSANVSHASSWLAKRPAARLKGRSGRVYAHLLEGLIQSALRVIELLVGIVVIDADRPFALEAAYFLHRV